MTNGIVKPVPLEYMRFPTKTGPHVSEWQELFLRRERSEAVRSRNATTFERPFYLVQVVLPHSKAAKEEVGVMLAGQRVIVSDNDAAVEAAVVRRFIPNGDISIRLAFDMQLDGMDNLHALRAHVAALVTTSAIGLLRPDTEFVEETVIGAGLDGESGTAAHVVKKSLHFDHVWADELKRRVAERKPEMVVKTWCEKNILFLEVDAMREQMQLAFKAVGKLVPHVNGNGNGNANGNGSGGEIYPRRRVAISALRGEGHL